MSTEKGEGSSTQEAASQRPTSATYQSGSQTSSQQQQRARQNPPHSLPATPTKQGEQPSSGGEHDRKPAAKRDQPSASTSPSTPEITASPRQVIAVSASKGPTAFFNLARKFLVTDEMCDLSALEGAIVSAVDAAHLLERSKLATIVRVQTSYVTVEPKRRKEVSDASLQQPSTSAKDSGAVLSPQSSVLSSPSPQHHRSSKSSSGRELRRARIVITVKRTENYKRWLEENPLQAIIAGDDGDEEEQHTTADRDEGEIQL